MNAARLFRGLRDYSTAISEIRLEKMELNEIHIFSALCYMMEVDTGISSFVLQECSLRPKQAATLMQTIAMSGSRLKQLTLNYISLKIDESKKWQQQYLSTFMGALCQLLESESTELQHLDISGLFLTDAHLKLLIRTVAETSASQLVSIHLSDNGISPSTRKYMLSRLGISLNNRD